MRSFYARTVSAKINLLDFARDQVDSVDCAARFSRRGESAEIATFAVNFGGGPKRSERSEATRVRA
jgi:hypothetical protein